jgi:hypothetical protein
MFYNIQNNNAPMYRCDLIPEFPTPQLSHTSQAYSKIGLI